MFVGQSEFDQLDKIMQLLGTNAPQSAPHCASDRSGSLSVATPDP